MFCGSQQAGLIQKTQGIAQPSAGASGNELQGVVLNIDFLDVGNIAQVLRELFVIDQAEHQTLTAADDRWRYFVLFSGGQYENDFRRRLFNSFEKGVECLFGEHVAFVYDVKLEASALSHKWRSFNEHTGIIH